MKRNDWRRVLAAALAAVLLLPLYAAALAANGDEMVSYSENTAKADNVISISTADDLIELSQKCTLDTWSRGKIVELDADLSLDGVNFAPIPSFGGTFHGNGHTISGFRLSGKLSTAGLFRTVQESGTVENLYVLGTVEMSGTCEAAGGIAGENYGRITGCSFSGSISGSVNTGGIAGYLSGVIRSCTNNAVIGYPHVGHNVGGITGRSCGYIDNCENTGSIHGRKDVGGITGQMEPYIEMNLSEGKLAQMQRQLDELNALVSKAIDDAEGGAAGISSRLNSMSDYVESAVSEANDISVVIDVDGFGRSNGVH